MSSAIQIQGTTKAVVDSARKRYPDLYNAYKTNIHEVHTCYVKLFNIPLYKIKTYRETSKIYLFNFIPIYEKTYKTRQK